MGDSGGFCQKDNASTVFVALPIPEDTTKSGVTYQRCTTYTKMTPADAFTRFVDERTCVQTVGTADVMAYFFDGEPELALEECSSSIGDEDCSCTVCGEGMFELTCPTLGAKTECIA